MGSNDGLEAKSADASSAGARRNVTRLKPHPRASETNGAREYKLDATLRNAAGELAEIFQDNA